MDHERQPVSQASFPTACGVYVVWDSAGGDRPLYVGVAATQTIEQRWRGQHLRSRAGGSAMRRTLGVYLGLVATKLNVRVDGRFYPPEVEAEITRFLESCQVECREATSAEHAKELEATLIRELRPLLNVRGATPL
jgi:hypothetical protein